MTPASSAPSPSPVVPVAVNTRGLAKNFGPVAAVRNLDLSVPVGSVYGFLGPNGSGKTTTIRMLLGLVHPSAGTIELLGQAMPAHADAVLPDVGALVEGPAFYPFLSGMKNLRRFDAAQGGLGGTRNVRASEALERVGLTGVAHRAYRTYSLGMKQRLGLAATLLRPRRLLLLDEPTNGLDPQGSREIRALIRSLAAEGTTVLLSSHLLAEVEQVCTHAAVLHQGRAVAEGSLEELRGAPGAELLVRTRDTAEAMAVLAETPGVGPTRVEGATGQAIVVATLRGAEPEHCIRALVFAGVGLREVTLRARSLEDTFLALIGEDDDAA